MDFDVLIIGAGLGGLSVALSLPQQLNVGLVCKQDFALCASDQAQGGMAAVLGDDDSVQNHIEDTLIAGAGLCDPDVVADIVAAGPDAIHWLQQQQVPFTLGPDGGLHLTREGGHGQRRIVHAADQTGHVVTHTLQQALRLRPNVRVLTHHRVTQLLVDEDGCHGALAVHADAGPVLTLQAHHVVLATGGLGQLFAHTTNPPVATADGLALAWQAGCRMANLEFIQFHPTALALQNQPTFLISEALRGEGALLRRPDGHRFMPDHDPRAELAPRDIVARAIVQELHAHQLDHVLLDISHHTPDFIVRLFPTIAQRCLALGIDITTTPIPVAPAAHYGCGGVLTDGHGHTDVAHLYAVGEVASTGLHGANRLASNSLMECVVIGRRIAQDLMAHRPWPRLTPGMPTHTPSLPPNVDVVPQPFSIEALQALMSRHLNVGRSTVGMATLWAQLQSWSSLCAAEPTTTAHHMLLAARLITLSAYARHESRGGHYCVNHPQTDACARMSLLAPQTLGQAFT
ncbi:MAG: L-aspartate oxidase [Neisseriaceae bacterium]|nr:L-aspartate oxidase [Neisseriaceae bacterium]